MGCAGSNSRKTVTPEGSTPSSIFMSSCERTGTRAAGVPCGLPAMSDSTVRRIPATTSPPRTNLTASSRATAAARSSTSNCSNQLRARLLAEGLTYCLALDSVGTHTANSRHLSPQGFTHDPSDATQRTVPRSRKLQPVRGLPGEKRMPFVARRRHVPGTEHPSR